MTTAADLLNLARAQLGIVEGPGSNNVKFNTWFYGHPVVGDNYAWCDAFVQWLADQTGCADLFPAPKSAYCPTSLNGWKAMGRFGMEPRVGAQVFYQWPGHHEACHTGIVEEIPGDGSIIAIEGNTDYAGGGSGGRVMRQRRRANIIGYGYPAYADAPAVIAAKLDVDGALGPQTIMALQRLLRVGVDGIFGPESKRALQAWLGVPVDGDVGPQTIRALQTRVGAGVDGAWGPDTTRHLQTYLNEH